MPYHARSRSRGPLTAWAGDSLWRRFVAWLAQSAILFAALALALALIWLVFVPIMLDGVTKVMTH